MSCDGPVSAAPFAVKLLEAGVITNPYLLVAINTYKERVYAA